MIYPSTIWLSICAALAQTTQTPQTTPATQPVETEVRETLERMVVDLRRAEEKQLPGFLTPNAGTEDERLTTVRLLGEMQTYIRPQTKPEAPMSELSIPLLLVRAAEADGPSKATACLFLVRLGSLSSVRLATYNVTLAKAQGKWRLTNISRQGKCGPHSDPLLDGFLTTPIAQ